MEVLSTLSVIRTDATHFNYALMGLDEETIELVTDVLKDCSYARLIELLYVGYR